MKIFHIIPFKLRIKISMIIRSSRLRRRISRIKDSRSNNKKSIFFVLNVPSHGNLGDHLIAYAIEQILRETFPKQQVEYFTTGDLECGISYLKRIIELNDTIFITGGGFLGDIYPDEEKRFHELMKYFPNNRIILFPQTFSYSNNSLNLLLKEAVALQNHCSKLVIATRERKSYDFIKSHFDKAVVLLLPDVVTFLNFSSREKTRNGIVICSRNDKEKDAESNQLFLDARKWSIENNVPLKFIDTQVPYSVNSCTRKKEIEKLIELISSSKLVITDRLHGMLYSIITGTPVIAIDNTTHKVSGAVNDWFIDVPYVRLCSNVEMLRKCATLLYNKENQLFDNVFFVNKLKSIFDYVDS